MENNFLKKAQVYFYIDLAQYCVVLSGRELKELAHPASASQVPGKPGATTPHSYQFLPFLLSCCKLGTKIGRFPGLVFMVGEETRSWEHPGVKFSFILTAPL